MFPLTENRDGSRTTATSNVELFVITVNGWKPLTIITKSSLLDFAVVLDPTLEKIAINLTMGLLAVSHVGSTALRVTVPAVTICGRIAPILNLKIENDCLVKTLPILLSPCYHYS